MNSQTDPIFFFSYIWSIKVPFHGPNETPVSGLLMMAALSFKARVDPLYETSLHFVKNDALTCVLPCLHVIDSPDSPRSMAPECWKGTSVSLFSHVNRRDKSFTTLENLYLSVR